MNENRITEQIIGSAIDIHKTLGPGLLESIYEECLAIELGEKYLNFQRQLSLPIQYKNHTLKDNFKIDMVVENKVVIELKAVERLMPVHDAQLLTRLRLTGCKVGLLINFNVPLLHKGIKRLVNDY